MIAYLSERLDSGLQNLAHGDGLMIAAIGMSIVIIALATISGFIAALPRFLRGIDLLVRRARGARRKPNKAETIAAIGAALHHERLRGR